MANPDVVEIMIGSKQYAPFIDKRLIKGILDLGARIKKNNFFVIINWDEIYLFNMFV